ncbi:hypothetical protein HDU87_001428 [Geranomyces variabilis]|uniref:STAS domain-containing protein n=1 Tax=Geranomyces variabilis TaxID=109894 RepID=A0AAD5XNE4_9FUNG|nr:hypothetical protein HDU87_001428 [Geranomyces variabilis]
MTASSDYLARAYRASPAVVLGLLFNLLDASSSSLLLFPADVPGFQGLGGNAVCMYLLSTIICQFVFALGGSKFPGAAGSMLIEILPFMHSMATTLSQRLGPDSPQLLPTVMVAYALSSLLLGIAFCLLGFLKVGRVVDYFPKLVLSGTIAAIGFQLFVMAVETTSSISSSWTTAYVRQLFESSIIQVVAPGVLSAALLSVLVRKIDHPLLIPGYFTLIVGLFYICAFAKGRSMDSLRHDHWLFEVTTADKPFFEFYRDLKFHDVDWSSIPSVLGQIVLLVIIGVLHPPIYVPALAASLSVPRFDMNLEFIGHGISNLIAGACGTAPNYLVYSNSLLFTRSGGGKGASFTLAVLTFVLLAFSQKLLSVIPTILAGGLVGFLGIELMMEPLWEGWKKLTWFEYLTVVGSMVNKRESSVEKIGRSTVVIRPSGYLFFTSISSLERKLFATIDSASTVFLDLETVSRMETSVVELVARVAQQFEESNIAFALCGVSPGEPLEADLLRGGVKLHYHQPSQTSLRVTSTAAPLSSVVKPRRSDALAEIELIEPVAAAVMDPFEAAARDGAVQTFHTLAAACAAFAIEDEEAAGGNLHTN